MFKHPLILLLLLPAGVGSSTAVSFSAFLNARFPPADLGGDITVSYSSPTGEQLTHAHTHFIHSFPNLEAEHCSGSGHEWLSVVHALPWWILVDPSLGDLGGSWLTPLCLTPLCLIPHWWIHPWWIPLFHRQSCASPLEDLTPPSGPQ